MGLGVQIFKEILHASKETDPCGQEDEAKIGGWKVSQAFQPVFEQIHRLESLRHIIGWRKFVRILRGRGFLHFMIARAAFQVQR
jgi:hypothetical protein